MKIGRNASFIWLFVCSLICFYAQGDTTSEPYQQPKATTESMIARTDDSHIGEKGMYDRAPKYNCPYPYCANRYFTQQELNWHIRHHHYDDEDL